MDEFWLRLAIVAGALAVAATVSVWQRARVRRPVRDIASTGLEGGVYLLTSSSCPTCRAARSRVRSALGEDGFEEIEWEQDPGMFADLGVDAVPALLVVGESGDGRLHPGAGRAAIASL